MTKTFDNSAELELFIKGVEEESRTKFITYIVDQRYNDKDWHPSPLNRVHWEWDGGSGMPAIEFSGIPFMFVGKKILVCHQGKDLAKAKKQKYREEKAKKMTENHSFSSERCLWQGTKKVGCPAGISITKICTFPKFKVSQNKEWGKKTTSKMLRKALETDPIVWKTCYAVAHQSVHAGHATGKMEESIPEPVDVRVEERIGELSRQGVRRVSEVKRHLAQFVKAELLRGTSPPPLARRRFFPSEKDLRNIMASQPGICEESCKTARRRSRTTYLRKKCINLTKEIMDKIDITEDQDTLKELSQKLTTLLEDLTPQAKNEDGMPLHLLAKRVRVSDELETTPMAVNSRYTHAESMREAHTMPGLKL